MMNFYETMGVSKDASQDEIKSVYRKLAREHHPDISPESEERFKDITEAYNTLSDPEARRKYDLSLGGPTPFGFPNESQVFVTFHRRSNTSIRAEIELGLPEILRGTKRTLEFRRLESCDACNGLGAADGKQCEECKGRGAIVKEASQEIELPPGCHKGTIMVSGMGNREIHANPPGDLIISVRTRPDPNVVYRGDMVIWTTWADPVLMLLGGKLEKESPFGETVAIDLEGSRTSPSQIIIQNAGLPLFFGLSEPRADLVVRVVPMFPDDLTEEQRGVLEQYLSSRMQVESTTE